MTEREASMPQLVAINHLCWVTKTDRGSIPENLTFSQASIEIAKLKCKARSSNNTTESEE